MSFDLNINNYTRSELIEMFELPPNYDRNILEIKEAKLKDSIINNKEINKETQIQTINFLLKAKNMILNGPNPASKNTLTDKLIDFYNSSYDLKPSKIEDPGEHMVQKRPEKPYLSSYPSEFFPGIINPLKKRTIRKNLNIDSRFRENYYATTSSNFHINLPTDFNDVVQMQLANIELPETFFVFSKQYGNNFFSIKLVNGSGTFFEVVSIPDGNYTKTTLMDMINKQLDNLALTINSDFGHIIFVVNLTNDTGTGQTMVGFDGSQSVGASFELNFQADRYGVEDRNTPLPLKMGWNLGFRNGIYVNNQNYVSEGIVDVTGPRYLFLAIDDHNNNVNNNFFSAFNSSILNKNILARISLQSNTFNILTQNNLNIVTTPREYFGPVNLQIFDIQLLDEYGRIVDLNNMDFSFCLTLTTSYDI